MKRVASLIMLLLVASLAACGGASGPSTSLRVTMTDFAFSPNSFTVPAGQPISIDITNNGAVSHSFAIMQAGHEINGHFTDADKAYIYWLQAEVPPGESVNANFTAPSQPGEYEVLCEIAGHLEAGMVGKLIVVK
jgi:uncharacterized cupredoxin-like copper-binding protein